MHYMPPQGLIMSWSEVKKWLAKEGALNKMYDPDLDGALGAVSIEALTLPSDEKIYFGTDKKYSIRFDTTAQRVIIRDEVKNIDVLAVVSE